MPRLGRRHFYFGAIALFVIFMYRTLDKIPQEAPKLPVGPQDLFGPKIDHSHDQYHGKSSAWEDLPTRYPPKDLQQLPKDRPLVLPKIQHEFSADESLKDQVSRESRLSVVKNTFVHSWNGYKKYAWLKDEVTPLSKGSKEAFGGWAATLVDSLDTLYIMDLDKEFDEAVEAIATIDFQSSTSPVLSVFETTIRYMGGLLSAYDLSGRKVLLEKALDLGTMLYKAFDTPNRMPVSHWDWHSALRGVEQKALSHEISADTGSLTLEFTRLSQLSGDQKFFDAVQRITDLFAAQQNDTNLPGIWPVYVNAEKGDFATGNMFSLGGMADSVYEYLPKMHMLLGGSMPVYSQMYEKVISAAKRSIFFRPMTEGNEDILLSGSVHTMGGIGQVDGSVQHLSCFVGGMVGIGAKIFERHEDLSIASRLTNGCVWAYKTMASGIMPEILQTMPCVNTTDCSWDEEQWLRGVSWMANKESEESMKEQLRRKGIVPGVLRISDGRYLLRPEAIESIFIMYRITGDKEWLEKAWEMFVAIEKATRTEIAYASLEHVGKEKPNQVDKMESFWTAETLKYFYLIFSEPNLISLDEYVFNTEAHPFRRPRGV